MLVNHQNFKKKKSIKQWDNYCQKNTICIKQIPYLGNLSHTWALTEVAHIVSTHISV